MKNSWNTQLNWSILTSGCKNAAIRTFWTRKETLLKRPSMQYYAEKKLHVMSRLMILVLVVPEIYTIHKSWSSI